MKRTLRVVAYLVCGLALLLGLFHLEENWRGKRAWEAWKAERIAKGDHYDWSNLAPPEVPDADNFAKEPLVEAAITGQASLLNGFKWSEHAPKFANWRLGQREDVQAWAVSFNTPDLETALHPIDGRLDELSRASQRSGCRMPFHYKYPEISEDPVPALLGFRAAARMMRLRASARLHSSDAAGAFEDTMAGLRLARQFQREPDLMSGFMTQALSGISMQPVWEGLSAHAWTEPQLVELQAELGRLNLIFSFRRAIESERAFGVQAGEAEARKSAWQRSKDRGWDLDASGEARTDRLKAIRLWLLIPEGWNYLGMRQTDRYYAESYLPALEAQTRQVHLAALHWATAQDAKTFFDWSYGMSREILASQAGRLAYHQNALDEATVACALERYRVARGGYPKTLDALSSAYLDKVPCDVLTGEPLHYHLNPDGAFVLYAVGSDGKDDGGRVVTGKEGRVDFDQGDWVWPTH